MVRVIGQHGAAEVWVVVELRGLTGCRGIGPAGKDMCESLDSVLSIGWDGISRPVNLGRAVRIQLRQTNRKQLHHFTGVVLIGRAPVAAVVVAHVQVVAHHGT